LAAALALLETASLFAAVCTATVLSQGFDPADWRQASALIGQAVALSLCCMVTFYLNDLYDLRIVRTLGQFAPRLIQSIGIAFLLGVLLETVVLRTKIQERPFVSSMVFIVASVFALRAVWYAAMRSRAFTERALIVGASPLTQQLIEEIEAQPHWRYTVVGVADDATGTGALPPQYPLMGPLSHLDKIIEEVRPDRVIVGLAERRGRLPVRQLLESRVRGTLVEDGVSVYERMTGKLAIESLTPSTLVFSSEFRKSRLDLAAGRLLSLLVSVAGLVVGAPVFAVIALAIKLDSAGPVFFIQERVGLYGRRFRLFKFRTMLPASGQTSEWERDNHDRITRVGHWLRKFRLDELPQFINVVRGEMNLVGPRPHPVSNFDLFIANIPYYSLRCLVRPGVTGWAQVRYGYANGLDEEIEKMRYDLFYIKHLSFELDLRILFETLKLVLFGRDGR
jgi:exopolysaccharide biosynthesis polyprenyl glycosylphosphotransferase